MDPFYSNVASCCFALYSVFRFFTLFLLLCDVPTTFVFTFCEIVLAVEERRQEVCKANSLVGKHVERDGLVSSYLISCR